jgi:16S rRNA (guanine527-N7)-methyltransferase
MPASRSHDVQRILTAVSHLRPRLDAAKLEGFLDELLEWNPSLGLVSRRDSVAVVTNLIRKSLEMWEFIVQPGFVAPQGPGGLNVADIGPGGGFPGVVWKLALPSMRLTLIERKDRRALFLERVVRRLALDDVTVLNVDLHDLVQRSTHDAVFDLAVAIAVAPPERMGALVERLLKPGGYFAAVRAQDEQAVTSVGTHLQLRARAVLGSGAHLLYQKR